MKALRLLIRTVALLLALSLPASSGVMLRVGVLRAPKPDSVQLVGRSGLVLIDPSGKQTPNAASDTLTITVHGQSVQLITNAPKRIIYRSLRVQSQSGCPITIKAPGVHTAFRGRIRFSARQGHLLIVNEVSLEDYVRGVVANEMRREWPTEALKAQAVLARTLAFERFGSHGREGFDICDTTHCQVYRGVLTETPTTDAAVRATSGQILTWQDQPIQALYCSCCGGVTASAYASKPIANAPYLATVEDTLDGASACKDSPHFNWNFTIPAGDLAAALQSDPHTNPGAHLRDLRVIRTDTSNRALFIAIDGDRSREVDAYDVWNVICRQLGWGSVKSTRLSLTKHGNLYTFKGHGLGHGIGLCQWGAGRRAKSGWNYRRILAFYYPGTGLSRARAEKGVEKP